MSTWLKLLPLELDDISESDIIEPTYELEKNDHKVGEMSDMSKRLFTLGQILEKDANQYHLDFQYCNVKEQKVELEAKSYEYIAKAGLIKQMLWVGIRDEFGLWGNNIGVRAGFIVVTKPDTDDMPPIMRLLGGFEL